MLLIFPCGICFIPAPAGNAITSYVHLRLRIESNAILNAEIHAVHSPAPILMQDK